MKNKEEKFDLKKMARQNTPLSFSFFKKVKEDILGKEYELSLVLCGEKTSRNLNKKFRKKDKSTNVLSFPIDKNTGEIFIDLSTTKKQVQKFDMSFKNLTLYFFIHGCLHLKGLAHGSKMDKEEKRFLKKHK